MKVEDILEYCDNTTLLLHNPKSKVHVDELMRLRPKDRKSLCLIRAYVKFWTSSDLYFRNRVWAGFRYGHKDYRLPVTGFEYWKEFQHIARERQTAC